MTIQAPGSQPPEGERFSDAAPVCPGVRLGPGAERLSGPLRPPPAGVLPSRKPPQATSDAS
jgi:hypothetical protein